MKQRKILIMAIILLPSIQLMAQENWKVKEGYNISFSGTKANGTFRGLEGMILFDPTNLAASKFNVSVAVETISTGNKTKDKHARGDSWFDAASFPKIKFSSEKIVEKNNNDYEVFGNLELKGISKEISVQFTFSREGTQGFFKGRMQVDREDFGIEGNFFAFVVGTEFEIDLEIPVELIND